MLAKDILLICSAAFAAMWAMCGNKGAELLCRGKYTHGSGEKGPEFC